MKTLSVVIALILSTSVFAQGSKYRAQYEKEKNGPRGECPVEWEPMQSGIDYRTIRCLGDEDDLDLHVVRVDPRKWRLDTAVFSGANARQAASQTNAAFVLNANFFDTARKPLGIVVRDGKRVHGPRDSGWQSIFYVTESGRARIVLPSKWSSVKNAAMAVQAGPRLVVDGHTNTSVRNNYAAPRAGVCIQWDEEVLFFATPADRKLHIKEIGRITRRGEIDGGLACKEAMLFDGGHSVNLFVDGERKDVSINQDPVPVYVVATER